MNKPHVDVTTVRSVQYEQNSSDSSTICTLSNVLPPIGYEYHHPMADMIGPNLPPPVYGTVIDEHRYPTAVSGGVAIDGGSSGTNCFNIQTEVKANTRIRSYESERGKIIIICTKYI